MARLDMPFEFVPCIHSNVDKGMRLGYGIVAACVKLNHNNSRQENNHSGGLRSNVIAVLQIAYQLCRRRNVQL